MEIFITLLTVLLVFVCLLMVLIILMQRPKQEGLGAAFGGGMTDQVFGAQTTNVLQKGTVYFAVFFFIATATLAVLKAKQQKGEEELGKGLVPAEETVAEETSTEEGAGDGSEDGEEKASEETPASEPESDEPATGDAKSTEESPAAPEESAEAAPTVEIPKPSAPKPLAPKPLKSVPVVPVPEGDPAPAGQ